MPSRDHNAIFESVTSLSEEIEKITGVKQTGTPALSQEVIPSSILRNTRGYLEQVANQVNGCYHQGWFDASAVMLRRLLETLIIECFEKYNLATRVKNSAGDFLFLRDLVETMLKETSWNLSRSTRAALPKLKDLGDKSAHSRRFNAHRSDIEKLLPEIRVVVQELTYLAGLK